MNWRKQFRFFFRRVTTQDIDQAIERVSSQGDWQHVLWLCNRHLKRNSQAVPVVLVRARCYQALGQNELHRKDLALAYALDDTYVPAIYQRAVSWVEDKQTEDAIRIIALIKDHPAIKDYVNSLLGTLCSRRAGAELASEYQLRAWMANFDHIRFANSFLFSLAYVDVDELRMASEHVFWAETLLPYVAPTGKTKDRLLAQVDEKLGVKPRHPSSQEVSRSAKLRIGYWGGDFKEHSVRYFFRPLLEGHDQGAVDVYVYDDNFMNAPPDQHTEAIRSHAHYFQNTMELSDDEVVALIQSHQLDVLVDVQGHTSANRLHLWQARLARIQMTGLAYPPTTGLRSVDYKFVDAHMVHPEIERYYAERPLVFPESFWCFDPKTEASYNVEPPYRRQSHITLGCWGNAAKISKPLMQAWARILNEAPNARLQVVSHTFGDPVTEKAFIDQLRDAGLPLERVACRGAYGLDELWVRYQEVDLMLDTYPFNGGTTSSWSLYAGVPVLTLAGQSLQSRMGQSMMTNLGFPEYVVDNADAYVNKALDVICRPEQLDAFRAVARQRFKSSGLGDGTKFARQFEELCRTALANLEADPNGVNPSESRIPPLPLSEMLRRARMVRYHGQLNAFERILNVARKHYGNDLRVRDFEVEGLMAQASFDAVRDVCCSVPEPSVYMLHALALTAVVEGKLDLAEDFARQLIHADVSLGEHAFGSQSHFKQQQMLWSAWLAVRDQIQDSPVDSPVEMTTQPEPRRLRWLIVVVGRDGGKCDDRAKQLRDLLEACPHAVDVRTCDFWARVETLNAILADEADDYDHVIAVRDHVQLADTAALDRIAIALKDADIVSPAGALRWVQKEWAQDVPEYKYWGLMRPSLINKGSFELYFAGEAALEVLNGARVLDGQMLAFSPAKVRHEQFDERLEEAGYWAEEAWTNKLAEGGSRLAVHRGLGVIVNPTPDVNSLHTSAGLHQLLSRLNVDPLAIPIENYDIQTLQVRTPGEGLSVARAYLT